MGKHKCVVCGKQYSLDESIRSLAPFFNDNKPRNWWGRGEGYYYQNTRNGLIKNKRAIVINGECHLRDLAEAMESFCSLKCADKRWKEIYK